MPTPSRHVYINSNVYMIHVLTIFVEGIGEVNMNERETMALLVYDICMELCWTSVPNGGVYELVVAAISFGAYCRRRAIS